MYQKLSEKGVNIPNGFATTALGYWEFIKQNDLDKTIKAELANYHSKKVPLPIAAKNIPKN